MLKSDIIQNINDNLEKILEDYIEIFDMLKNPNNDIVSLFFVKRSCLNIINNVQEIYYNILNLNKKYHQDNSQNKIKNNDKIISLLNEDF